MNDRQSEILSYVTEHGHAKNSDLMRLVGNCSSMTLWRDLTKLEQDGLVIRTRGGVIASHEANAEREANFSLRSIQNTEAKEEIAAIGSAILHQNHAYFLDAGTTVLALTRRLPEGHFNIVTSAANTATEIARRNGYTVTLLGGQISGSTFSCSGPQTDEMLKSMNIDIAVMATSGFSVNGNFTSGALTEAQLKRQVITKAALTVMLMDNSKIGRSHPFTFSTLDDIDVLVGDSALSDEFLHIAEEHNVRVFSPRDGLTNEERYQIYHEIFLRKYGYT